MCRFGAASYVPALTLEKPLFVRERADGLYKPITYLLSKFFDELFITLFTSLIFSIFVFFVVDLQVRPAIRTAARCAVARRGICDATASRSDELQRNQWLRANPTWQVYEQVLRDHCGRARSISDAP